MLKKEFEKKKKITINETYNNLAHYKISHDLITRIHEIKINAIFSYYQDVCLLDVKGNIVVSFDAIDARDGSELTGNVDSFPWEEQYLFESTDASPDANLVIGDEFDIVGYAVDEIVLNIPINFTKNYAKISFDNGLSAVFSEDEYNDLHDKNYDSRWDKLKTFNFDREDK